MPQEPEIRQSGELFRKENKQDSEKDWVWGTLENKWVESCRKRI